MNQIFVFYFNLLICGLIILIVATDVLVSTSKLPGSVQFTLTELRLSNMVGIVSVDISGFELRAEFLVKIKKC